MYKEVVESKIHLFESMSLSFFEIYLELQREYATAFADTFVLATNIIHAQNGTIVTSDSNFGKVGQSGKTKVIFFR
jgi:predicted nucleic acid-binding protein